MIGKIKAIKLR